MFAKYNSITSKASVYIRFSDIQIQILIILPSFDEIIFGTIEGTNHDNEFQAHPGDALGAGWLGAVINATCCTLSFGFLLLLWLA